MSNESLLVAIPEQPLPTIPETALEKVDPPDLAQDLESLQHKQTLLENEIKLKNLIAEYHGKVHALEAERTMLKQRKIYAVLLFTLAILWLGFIGLFLFLAGLGKMKVSDSVLIALITTTTINVLGLFYIVARWLFPNKNNIETKDSSPK